MSSHTGQLWVEPMKDIILARVRGVPSESLLRDCQEKILQLVRETNQRHVLYDCLELEAPPIEVPLVQWNLDKDIKSLRLVRAIVVPNTKLAYLARIAFGEEDCRVFYNDLTAAVQWLSNPNS